MSHVHEGPLATYNSLTDPNLAGYFGNTRMRRHLKKSGLVSRRGEIVSENQYRLNMARREHKKHVKDLLAQAIVHKTLDLERYRQVEIKKKLEEIAKIELVRRVRADRTKRQDDCLMPLLSPKPPKRKPINRSVVPRKTPQNLIDMERSEMKDNLRPASIMQDTATRGRKGDEEVLPYLSPRSQSRPQSGKHSDASSGRRRPKSAPAPPRNRQQSSKSGYTDTYDDVIYVDNNGRPVSPPPPSDRQSFQDSLRDVRPENIDTRHLYALDSEALQQYALRLSKGEKGRDGASSPYLLSQIPQPPRRERARSAKSPRRSARMSQRPDSSRRQGVQSDSGKKDSSTVEQEVESPHSEGALMLHRQEPAMMHQGEVQTLCEITMKYHGPNLTLPRDQFDPTQEVSIEQQHCGGNTLPVFKERLQAGSTFSFVSRRHRGYPFSLTLYIDGSVDCRVSTCCEYKHGIGVKLGGKMGHFSLTGITGATPCYKCKLSVQAPPRSLKLKKGYSRKKKQQDTGEVVTVEGTPRKTMTPTSPKEEPQKSDDEETIRIERHEINESEEDDNVESEKNVVVSVEDDDTSRGGNSVKSNFRGDKYVPHKSNRVKHSESEKEGSSSSLNKEIDKDSDVKEKKDDAVSSKDTDRNSGIHSQSEDVRELDIRGTEQTEKTNTVHVNSKTEGKDSEHIEDIIEENDLGNQDTCNEIEEEIFSEYNDKTKADDIIEEEIVGEETVEEESSNKNGSRGGSELRELKSESIEEDLAGNSYHGNSEANYQHNINEDIIEEISTADKSESEIKTETDHKDQSRNKKPDEVKDNYDDDFEEEDSKGVPLTVDIQNESDRELLDQVNELGKRVVLEISEENPDNISAELEFNKEEKENVVRVKKFQKTVLPDIDLPGIEEEEEGEEMEDDTSEMVEYFDYGSSVDETSMTESHPHRARPHPRLQKQDAVTSSTSLSESDERFARPKSRLRRSYSEIKTRPNYKSDGSISSRSVSSATRSRDSAYNWAGNTSAPEWLPSWSQNGSNCHRDYREYNRPRTAWRREDGAYMDNSQRLRPVSARRTMSMREREDYEFMRAKFYPPVHDCLSHSHGHQDDRQVKNKPASRKPLVRTNSRKRDININIDSGVNKSRGKVNTVIHGMTDESDAGGVRVGKGKCGNINIKIPGVEQQETADEVSDLEPDHPPPRPIKVDIKFNMNEKTDKEKVVEKKKESEKPVKVKSPKKVKEKPVVKEKPILQQILEEPVAPGVSEAYALHILKVPVKTKKSKPRGRSRSPKKGGRGRSPSPKRNPLQKDLKKARKDIDAKVEDGKQQIEKLLQECLEVFGEKLKEQQEQFAEQLQKAHGQFAEDLSEAQAALSSHGETVKGDLSTKLIEATTEITGQLKDSQTALRDSLDVSQKALASQLEDSQKILGDQLQESQNNFGELVKDSQNVLAGQLKDSQQIFSDQVQDSQKLLSEQLTESQNTLTNQMKDTQIAITSQLKESQTMIADQVKESQQLIAEQLKDSQETIAEQLKAAKTNFAQQFVESKQTLTIQLEESQNTMSQQLATSQQLIADDLTNSQNVLSKQLDDNQKILSDQLMTSTETIDKQLHQSQAKINEQLEDSQKQIDNTLVETLDKIDKQEQDATERLLKESEESQKKIQQQEEDAKLRMQEESEASQKKLMDQEEAAREKLKQESEETQKRLADQEAQAKEQMEKERAETQRRLEEQENRAREQMQKESEETQKRIAEQEAVAKEKLLQEGEETRRKLAEQSEESQKMLAQQSEESSKKLLEQSEETSKKLSEQSEETQKKLAEQSEETQKKLADQEQKAREEMEKERDAAAQRLAEQEAAARENMKKEGDETARRLKEQEEQAKEQMKKESEDSAKRLAEQEEGARQKLQKESEETQKRLVQQEEKTREMMQKESEESAKRLAEQEATAKESLLKEGEDSAKRLAEQEQKARQEMQKEADDTSRKLAEQEQKARQEMQKDADETSRKLAEQEQQARQGMQKDADETARKLAEQEAMAKQSLQKELKQNVVKPQKIVQNLDQRDGMSSAQQSPRFATARRPPVKEYTYRMPEVVYMKNDQKMELIEKPRKVVDDDMMYFCNQDDVDDNESYESLFEGFDGDVIGNNTTISDSGIEQSESFVSERSEDSRDRGRANECRRVEENMDKLKLKLEKKMTGLSLPLNESDTESGMEQSFTEAVREKEEQIVREKGEQFVREKEGNVVKTKLEDEKKDTTNLNEGHVKNITFQELGDLKLDLSSVKDETAEGNKLSGEHKAKKRRSHETVEELIAKNKYEDDFEEEAVEQVEDDRRHIIGLRADETRVDGKTISVDVAEKEKEQEKEGTLPEHRRVEGYSSEDEDAEGPRSKSIEVTADIHAQKKESPKKRRRSSSSSSSSSSSASDKEETPRPQTPERKTRSPEPEKVVQTAVVQVHTARSEESAPPRSDRSERSTTSGSLTTETESTLESNRQKVEMPKGRRSSSSSSSSTLSSDSEDEKYQRKKREKKQRLENEKRRKDDEEKRRKEAEEREKERKRQLEEEERKRQEAEEERKNRFELQRQQSQDRLRQMEEQRKLQELERQQQMSEQTRAKEEERKRRQAEEERMTKEYEKQLSFIQSQRESESTLSVTNTTVSEEPKDEVKVEVTPIKDEKRKSSSSSSSSSSSESESEDEKKKATPFSAAIASLKTKEVVEDKPRPETTSSSSTETSSTTRSDREKVEEKTPVVQPMKIITEEEKKDSRRSSTSSVSSSSSSSSGGEYTVSKESKPEQKKDDAVQETIFTKKQEAEISVSVPETKEPERKRTSSSSSSSGSSSESESDEDNKKVEETKVKEDLKKETTEAVIKEPAKIERKDSTSSTTSYSASMASSDVEFREPKSPKKLGVLGGIQHETKEKEDVKIETSGADSNKQATIERKGSTSSLLSSSSSSYQRSESRSDMEFRPPEKPKEPASEEQAKNERRGSTSSTSSSSSSSYQRSESVSDREFRPPEKPKEQAPFGGIQHEPLITDKTQISKREDMPVSSTDTEKVKARKEESEDSSSDSSSSDSDSSDSEEEGNKRKQKQGSKPVTSESEPETMHGGHDPENVAKSGTSVESHLVKGKIRAPMAHYGSILPMVKDSNALDLNGVKLDDTQLTEITSYIAEVEHIKSVTLRNCALDDSSFQNVAKSLQVTQSSPNILNFSTNQLGAKSLLPLSVAIKNKPSIEIVILNGNPVGNVGCKVLMDALVKTKDPFPFLRRSSGYLTPSEARQQKDEGNEVDLEKDAGDAGCNVKELDLGDCKIADAGVAEISRFLESNKTLVSLNLYGNRDVSSSGWERLGQALKKNKTLKTLSLDFTNIGDSGIENLAKGLRVNTGLRSLELESTGLTEKGGQILRDLLKENTSIRELTVTPGNDISDGTLEEIRKYLALNNSAST